MEQSDWIATIKRSSITECAAEEANDLRLLVFMTFLSRFGVFAIAIRPTWDASPSHVILLLSPHLAVYQMP